MLDCDMCRLRNEIGVCAGCIEVSKFENKNLKLLKFETRNFDIEMILLEIPEMIEGIKRNEGKKNGM